MKQSYDPRQVGRGVLIDVESLLSPPEKIALGLDGEPKHERRLSEDGQIADKVPGTAAYEFDRATMVPIIAVEQGDQRSGVDDDAWSGESRRGWPCGWC